MFDFMGLQGYIDYFGGRMFLSISGPLSLFTTVALICVWSDVYQSMSSVTTRAPIFIRVPAIKYGLLIVCFILIVLDFIGSYMERFVPSLATVQMISAAFYAILTFLIGLGMIFTGLRILKIVTVHTKGASSTTGSEKTALLMQKIKRITQFILSSAFFMVISFFSLVALVLSVHMTGPDGYTVSITVPFVCYQITSTFQVIAAYYSGLKSDKGKSGSSASTKRKSKKSVGMASSTGASSHMDRSEIEGSMASVSVKSTRDI